MIAIGKAIRTLRATRGMTQKELAERAEITASFLSLVESDRRSISLKVIDRVASALDVTSDVLIWEAVELPENLSEDDRRMCEFARIIVRRVYENAGRAADDPEYVQSSD